MTGAPGIRRLVLAAELALERRVRDLRAIEAQLDALREEAAALRQTGADGGSLLAMRGEAATARAAWEALRDRRILDLAGRAAALAVAREEARAEAARACGRIAAIRRLKA